jgi:hypothetical protein
MKSVPVRLDKLERKLGHKDDDVCMVFVPSGDRHKDEEKLQRLRDVSERTGKPVIIFDT